MEDATEKLHFVGTCHCYVWRLRHSGDPRRVRDACAYYGRQGHVRGAHSTRLLHDLPCSDPGLSHSNPTTAVGGEGYTGPRATHPRVSARDLRTASADRTTSKPLVGEQLEARLWQPAREVYMPYLMPPAIEPQTPDGRCLWRADGSTDGSTDRTR